MKLHTALFATCLLLGSSSYAQFKLPTLKDMKLPGKTTTTGITNADAVAALKDALKIGTDTAVSVLSKADGFYKDLAVKIFLPPEAQNIQKNIAKIPGGQKMLDKAILAMNRAAEDASQEATPIFKNAITSMTITDGINIVKGADNAATTFLRSKTYDQLKDLFTPKIRTSLSKPLVAGISAEKAYSDLIKAYNMASLNGKLFSTIKTNSLSEHVTVKGLDGLFSKVALQEKNIRTNGLAQVTEILRKVFGRK
ncbi:MAG: DUF4197 domain-containing protein [Bacteroidota bacterium]